MLTEGVDYCRSEEVLEAEHVRHEQYHDGCGREAGLLYLVRIVAVAVAVRSRNRER